MHEYLEEEVRLEIEKIVHNFGSSVSRADIEQTIAQIY